VARNDSDDEYSKGHTESDSDVREPTLIDRLMTEGDSLGTKFQMTTAAVIMLCTVSMAIETDYWPDSSIWNWWNNAVLIYFCVELGIRLAHQGIHFFGCCGNKECMWNYFDFLIVLICILDQWLQPLLMAEDAGQGFGVLRIFRVFRILRTLRVLRIFRACTQLNNLAVGLLDSIGTVFWIALLMLMFMLIFAIVLTDIAGNQAKLATEPGDLFFNVKEDIDKYWGSVGKSLVTLFQFLTLDDWTNISRQVYDELPAMWFVFFLYIFLMGFAMLSLLTGVVAEHMGEVSTETKKEQKKDDDEALCAFLDKKMKKLEQLAVTPKGSEHSGAGAASDLGMSREEFKTFLSYDEVKQRLKELDACLAEHEADEFWDCLDRDGDGYLTHDELKKGILRLRGELQPKDMLRIRYAAERVVRRLRGGQGEVATQRKLEEISTNLTNVEARLLNMHGQLREFMSFVKKGDMQRGLTSALSLSNGGCC